MTITSIKRIILLLPGKLLTCLTLDTLELRKTFQDKYLPYQTKRRGAKKNLSQEEKEHNKNHSRKRVVIEHIICRMKKYRIMGDIFRNKLRKYNRISDIVSGLVNYRTLSSF